MGAGATGPPLISGPVKKSPIGGWLRIILVMCAGPFVWLVAGRGRSARVGVGGPRRLLRFAAALAGHRRDPVAECLGRSLGRWRRVRACGVGGHRASGILRKD